MVRDRNQVLRFWNAGADALYGWLREEIDSKNAAQIHAGTAGYGLLIVTCGDEALERLRSGGSDLVLTDQIMPGMFGTKLVNA